MLFRYNKHLTESKIHSDLGFFSLLLCQGLCLSLLCLLCYTGCDSPSDLSSPFLELGPALSQDELLNPENCKGCHPQHYRQWAASMHAYSSIDPVFRALNQLGQEETNGSLGSFCVQCHAPVALELGKTENGDNLDQLDFPYQGITCAYCHQIDAVEGTHNNPLKWVQDGIMRGGIRNPVAHSAHQSQYHLLFDRTRVESSDLCGSCHDIVTPTGVHLERTYLEWKESLFNDEDPLFQNTCNACHMTSKPGYIASLDGLPQRIVHDHLMPGVDVALTPFPDHDLMVEAVQGSLRSLLLSEICVLPGVSGGGEVEVYLENLAAGHRVPSGAALDRRMWVELSAFNAEGEVLFESGQVNENQAVVDQAKQEADRQGSSLWMMHDQAYNSSGEITHHFWEIDTVERLTLPSPTILSPLDPEYEDPHVLHRYRFGSETPIDRIDIRVWIRPMGRDILVPLVEQGRLEQAVLDRLPTFEITNAARIWWKEDATLKTTPSGREGLCSP